MPAFRCKVPWLPNDTYAIQSDAHASIVNETIPLMADGTYDSCHVTINGSTQTCVDWVFDNSVFTNTASSQVCLFYVIEGMRLILRSYVPLIYVYFVYHASSISTSKSFHKKHISRSKFPPYFYTIWQTNTHTKAMSGCIICAFKSPKWHYISSLFSL